MCISALTIVLNMRSKVNCKRSTKKWFIGRVPPSSFEYPEINDFYTPKRAKDICEKNLQCAGFTFKGTKTVLDVIPEIYFFHYINESSNSLTTEIKYPHWTTYIVGSRDYIVISGSYALMNCHRGKILSK